MKKEEGDLTLTETERGLTGGYVCDTAAEAAYNVKMHRTSWNRLRAAGLGGVLRDGGGEPELPRGRLLIE